MAWDKSAARPVSSWLATITGFLLFSLALFLLYSYRSFSAVGLLLSLSTLLLVAAWLTRRGWFHLLGPVFFYEMIRNARRRRFFVYRFLYVGFLFLIVFWLYLGYIVGRHRPIRVNEMVEISYTFYMWFIGIQFACAVLLTPAFVAPAVTEEKVRRTLDYVLATDLRDIEIILGKFAARLLNLSMLLLAGLPVLSCLQFLGGIDPELLLCSFAFTGLTMISMSAFAILASVYARQSSIALSYTYLGWLLYLLFTGLTWLFFVPIPLLGPTPISVVDWLEPLPVAEFVEWANAGNTISVVVRLLNHLDSGGSLDAVLPGYLRDYAITHLSFAFVCLVWATHRLRRVYVKEKETPVREKTPSRWSHWSWRPQIGNTPMLWKELFCVGKKGTIAGAILHTIVVLTSFVPVVLIFDSYRQSSMWGTPRFIEDINVWLRISGPTVSTFLLISVSVRAAGSITGERERETLDTLLTTPLDSNSILFAKIVGAVASVRWWWLWLAAIGWVGLVTGALSPFAVPLLVAAWFIYAFVVAEIGVLFSIMMSSTLKATLATLAVVILAVGGHWALMGMCCYFPLAIIGTFTRDMETLIYFEGGQTPPFVLGMFAFSTIELAQFLSGRVSHDFREAFFYCLLGVAIWTTAGACLWRYVNNRFAQMTQRTSQDSLQRSFGDAGEEERDAAPESAGEDLDLKSG